MNKWGKFIQTQLPQARQPTVIWITTIHRFVDSQDPGLDEKRLRETEGKKVSIMSQYIVIGTEGAALQIDDNAFTQDWYDVLNTSPHVTILVNDGYESNDLGPMVKRAGGTVV